MIIVKTQKQHIEKLMDIYNYYVEHTTVTFHLDKLDKKEFSGIVHIQGEKDYTYTIIDGEKIIGYCSLERFNRKEAYKRSAYVSIYLDKKYTGKDFGSRILKHLEKEAVIKDIKSLIALVCGENTQSIALFIKNGYKFAGELKKAGEKFGRLLNVVYYQKLL